MKSAWSRSRWTEVSDWVNHLDLPLCIMKYGWPGQCQPWLFFWACVKPAIDVDFQSIFLWCESHRQSIWTNFFGYESYQPWIWTVFSRGWIDGRYWYQPYFPVGGSTPGWCRYRLWVIDRSIKKISTDRRVDDVTSEMYGKMKIWKSWIREMARILRSKICLPNNAPKKTIWWEPIGSYFARFSIPQVTVLQST